MHLSCNLYTVAIETCAEVSKVLTIHLQGAEADVSGEGGSGGEEERVRAKQPKKRSKSTASDKPSSTPKRLDLLSLKVCVVCHRECKEERQLREIITCTLHLTCCLHRSVLLLLIKYMYAYQHSPLCVYLRAYANYCSKIM